MVQFTWDIFKSIVDSKLLKIQYSEDTDFYYVWTTDTVLNVLCKIAKDGGSDQTDFETNYQPTANIGYDALKTNSSAVVQPISATALPLPTGATTAANQVIEIASLASIDTKLTSPLSVTGPLTDVQLRLTPVPVSAAALPLPSGAATSALQTQPGVDIGDVTINNASGGSAVNIQDGGNSLTVDGSLTVTQGTGTNLHTVVDSGTITTVTNVVHVDDNGGSITVDGPLTDTQLRTTPVPVSGTVAATQSGAWNITNISGTVSLPTGAATSALQTTSNTSLSSLVSSEGIVTSSGSSTTTDPFIFINTYGHTTLRADFSNTWTGSVFFEGSVDGVTYDILYGTDMTALDGQITNLVNASGQFKFDIAGLYSVKFGDTDTGTCDIKLAATKGSSIISAVQAIVYVKQAGVDPFLVSATTLPLPTGAATEAKQTQPGVDIGDVTINNAAGAAAVNIQDGGNSITIDGSLTTVSTVTNLSQLGGTAISMNTGVRDAGTQRVTIATNDVVPASQSGTWTVQPGNTANTTAWKVDGSAVTQPISGSLTTVSTVTNLSQLGGTAISMNSGTRDAGTQRVTIATNDVVPASQSGSWSVTANAGTNLNTSTLALEAGGNLAATTTALQIMDDWDESDRAKVNPIVGQAGVQGGAGAVSATTQRIVIATDQTTIPIIGGTGTCTHTTGTATGSSSQALASNSSRKYLLIQNNSVAAIWFNFGGTAAAAAPSIFLGANASFVMENNFISTQAINVIRTGVVNLSFSIVEG